ncbi:MAG TPA: DNA repair protein RecN [Burkholderiales bacterium]|nr:DNA repair protein RecN [Burkholderiales bacterium]
MLRSLSIRDFAIVDRLDLEFQPGFTVLTGETGAGKSILIDALATVLGERAESSMVREGREKAEISAEFSVAHSPALLRYLAENDLSGDDGECLLRRVIDNSGRSRAYVNGRPAAVQQLKEIGEHLIDIHGQHAHQSLLRGNSQRELVDGYAGAGGLAAEVAAAHRKWQDVRRQLVALESNAQALANEREQLDWQAKELDALGFQAEEWEELQAEHRRLANASGLIEVVQFGLDTLSEGEASTMGAVSSVLSRLKGMEDSDPKLRDILDSLEPAQIQLQEAIHSLRHYQQRLDLDPQRLREVESRLDAVHTAARKFRMQIPDIPERLRGIKARLAELEEGFDADALRARESEAAKAYRAIAAKLTAARKKGAGDLAKKVTASMQALAMGGGAFEIALNILEEGGAHGLEQVEFLVAGHAGATPRPLAKVASGGELSRLSLAIQTVTSEVAAVPTLIFDEVDAGIGGRIAEIVGHMMKELGSRHQVMCVTHLPQVAAAADNQWQVAKATAGGRTASAVHVLDAAGRVEEIARMLGGVKITETTRKHAREMLETVGKAKRVRSQG